MTFKSILVANRGEIACRVLRTAHSLGYRTIAVYSDADRDARHVALADEAIAIGPAPAAQSYLDIARVIGTARDAGAGAIHPGYGFLSENAEFAQACIDAGIVFIGPQPAAIALMGNKAAAKRRMLEAGVACLPGYQGRDQCDDALAAAAAEIGFPVMIKAAAGGGGRGMRRVAAADDFAAALNRARSEASAAFGSDEVILERALTRPRHVEVQVLADAHGNTIHLGERDCSVQRRYQKVIEEAPCPVMTDELRARMGAAAVDAASSIGYYGVGTIEFLLDQAGDFFFMEMNTRLQVEHPVTEMITGLDLVAQQIRVAEGKPLGITQGDVAFNGHAIEARLYAEDPAAGFLPGTGRVEWLQFGTGDGIRVDTGIRIGDEITPFYDPLVAKIIASGADRHQALQRLRAALADTALFGLASNRDFLLDALAQEAFIDGKATTAFVEQHYAGGRFAADAETELAPLATLLQHLLRADAAHAASVTVSPALRDWASAGALVSHYRHDANETARVQPLGGNRYAVTLADERHELAVLERSRNTALVACDGRSRRLTFFAPDARRLYLATDRGSATFDNLLGLAATAEPKVASGKLLAPMHGAIVELNVGIGDRIAKGQRLCVLEAMKMQHELVADSDGTVRAVHIEQGAQVAADTLILDIAPLDATPATHDGPKLAQAMDFLAESEALYQLLAPLDDADFARETQFKAWTVNDVITHLHVWNQAAQLSLNDERALVGFLARVRTAMLAGDLRAFERDQAGAVSGTALKEQWRDFYLGMAERFAAADPKTRVKWAGPDMSVRSSITARLMETWAHGQALYDLLGVERVDADRLRNIAVLGINTFGWTFKNRGEPPPGPPPRVTLTAPSGETWEWHDDNATDHICGSATEFCQVVTQVRSIADTQLDVVGDVASAWMAKAQCFAGPPHSPPEPGTRFRALR